MNIFMKENWEIKEKKIIGKKRPRKEKNNKEKEEINQNNE